jgi:hypothetical protein
VCVCVALRVLCFVFLLRVNNATAAVHRKGQIEHAATFAAQEETLLSLRALAVPTLELFFLIFSQYASTPSEGRVECFRSRFTLTVYCARFTPEQWGLCVDVSAVKAAKLTFDVVRIPVFPESLSLFHRFCCFYDTHTYTHAHVHTHAYERAWVHSTKHSKRGRKRCVDNR